MNEAIQVAVLPQRYTALAPDGSEIRELIALGGGSMAHCTLPVAGVSAAVRHRTVEEIWYVLRGRGQLWGRRDHREEVVDLAPGVSVAIAQGMHFQFRNTSDEPLTFLLVTMPPWPGAEEAVRVEDHWPPFLARPGA